MSVITLIRLYLGCWQCSLLSHYHSSEFIVDHNHPHYRRYTRQYVRKRSALKQCWLIAGVFAALFPVAAVLVIMVLVGVFASFCVLDESE